MTTVPRAEQETVLTYDREANAWTAYSCVPTHIRKLTAITNGAVTVLSRTESGEPTSVRATLTAKQVRMVAQSTPRVMTDEQREQARERMRNLRKNPD